MRDSRGLIRLSRLTIGTNKRLRSNEPSEETRAKNSGLFSWAYEYSDSCGWSNWQMQMKDIKRRGRTQAPGRRGRVESNRAGIRGDAE